MPGYGGGKVRLGKTIAGVVRELEERAGWRDRPYVEPFCGMLGVGMHMDRPVIASDLNEDVVLLLRAMQQGWEPPAEPCSKEAYDALRLSSASSAERGFFGIACAFGHIFFAGYRVRTSRHELFRMFRESLLAMRPFLQRVTLAHADYRTLAPRGCTVYCDPPYRHNALQNNNTNRLARESFAGFDSDAFWDVVRAWSRDNLVVVSEYSAPDDFACAWQRSFRSGTNNAAPRRERTEKLFVWRHSPQWRER